MSEPDLSDAMAMVDKLRTEAQSFVDAGRDWNVRVGARNLMREAAGVIDALILVIKTTKPEAK